MKVTDQHKWERTKNSAAYIGWLFSVVYYLHQYANGAPAPDIELPMIIGILSVARMLKILSKEG
jgi:hypothetical protein